MKYLLASLILFLAHVSTAAIDPFYKEVMQRGYEIRGDSAVMPNGELCAIKDFNEGTCGLKFKQQDYCVPKGRYVWDKNACCTGLVSYLPDGAAGQAKCKPIVTVYAITLLSSIYFWIAVVMVIALLLLRKLGKNRRNRRK